MSVFFKAFTLLFWAVLFALAMYWLSIWPPQSMWDVTGWCFSRQVVNMSIFDENSYNCIRCQDLECESNWKSSQRYLAPVNYNLCRDDFGWDMTGLPVVVPRPPRVYVPLPLPTLVPKAEDEIVAYDIHIPQHPVDPDTDCVAFSAIFGHWCVGCNVDLGVAYLGSGGSVVAYKAQGQEVFADPTHANKHCGPSDRVFDLRGANATEGACIEECEDRAR